MKTKKKDVTLELVKIAEFGCKHCLWNGCECMDYKKFEAHVTHDGFATCKAYTYYD